LQAKNLDIGQNFRIVWQAGDHASLRTGCQDHVPRFNLRGFPCAVFHVHGVHAILRGADELSVAFDGLDLILAHEKFEALGVFGDDLRLAVLNGRPVQLARIHAFDAKFLGVFQLIPKFGIEQQRLGWNATHVQAGSAEEAVFFNQSCLEAELTSTDGGSVSGRPAADDGDVVGIFRQSKRSLRRMMTTVQTSDSTTGLWDSGTGRARSAYLQS